MSFNEPTDERVNSIDNRSIPIDIFDASVKSQKGQFVDITTLIPVTNERGGADFQNEVQQWFDFVSKTTASPEYKKFEQQAEKLLSEVTGQNFLLDIENTVMKDVQKDNSNERVYYANPYMMTVVKLLVKNGNNVGFYTSATKESSEKMRKAMLPEIGALPTISREDYQEVVEAYKNLRDSKIDEAKVLEVTKNKYPQANMLSISENALIINDRLEQYKKDPTYFLRTTKFPQLFIQSENGFFIDDNRSLVDLVVTNGWPKDRAIKCDDQFRKEYAIDVARKISSLKIK